MESDTRMTELYWVHGYLRDETGAGFRVPVFMGPNDWLYSCHVTPSGEIKGFVPLGLELQPAVEAINEGVVNYNREYSVGTDAPLIVIDKNKVHISSIDEISTWLLASFCRSDIDPYFQVMCAAVLWLPVSAVSEIYQTLKPSFAHEGWEDEQAEIYMSQQNRLAGPELASIRSRFLIAREANIIRKLKGRFGADLARHDLSDFLPLATTKRSAKMSDDIGVAASRPIILICEAISRYLRAIQMWATTDERNQDAALRRLLGALGILDRAKKVSGGRKFESLLYEIQRLIQIVYASFVSFRHMRRFGGIRGFPLVQSFTAAVNDAAAQTKYLDAESRFRRIESLIFRIDKRKKLIQGSSFIGRVIVNDLNEITLENFAGERYIVDVGVRSYQLSVKAKDEEFVRAERLEKSGSATTRGERYVNNTLDTYFPVKTYRRYIKSVLFASSSWFIAVTTEKIKSDLLWGGENHRALQRRLGVARFEVIIERSNAFSFLKSFVEATWRALEMKRLESGRIIIVHHTRLDNTATLAKFVGFFRAIEEVSHLYEPLRDIIDDIHLVTRVKNVDQIVTFESSLKKYLRDLEYRPATPEGTNEKSSQYENTVENILSDPILLIYQDNELVSDFVEVSSRVRGLVGSAVAFAEAG